MTCAVAGAVIDVIDDEELVDNAATVGEYVLEGFRDLQSRHDRTLSVAAS